LKTLSPERSSVKFQRLKAGPCPVFRDWKTGDFPHVITFVAAGSSLLRDPGASFSVRNGRKAGFRRFRPDRQQPRAKPAGV